MVRLDLPRPEFATRDVALEDAGAERLVQLLAGYPHFTLANGQSIEKILGELRAPTT